MRPVELLPPNRADYPLRRRTPQPRYNRQRGSRRGVLPRPRPSRRSSTPRVIARQRPHAEIGAIASNLSYAGRLPSGSRLRFCRSRILSYSRLASRRFDLATSGKILNETTFAAFCPSVTMTSGRCLPAIRVIELCSLWLCQRKRRVIFLPWQGKPFSRVGYRAGSLSRHPSCPERNNRCGSIPTQSLCFGRFLADIRVEPSVSFSRYARARNFAV